MTRPRFRTISRSLFVAALVIGIAALLTPTDLIAARASVLGGIVGATGTDRPRRRLHTRPARPAAPPRRVPPALPAAPPRRTATSFRLVPSTDPVRSPAWRSHARGGSGSRRLGPRPVLGFAADGVALAPLQRHAPPLRTGKRLLRALPGRLQRLARAVDLHVHSGHTVIPYAYPVPLLAGGGVHRRIAPHAPAAARAYLPVAGRLRACACFGTSNSPTCGLGAASAVPAGGGLADLLSVLRRVWVGQFTFVLGSMLFWSALAAEEKRWRSARAGGSLASSGSPRRCLAADLAA